MKKRNRGLGIAFNDEVLKLSQRAGHFRKQTLNSYDAWDDMLVSNYLPSGYSDLISAWRIIFFIIIFIGVFFLLFLRMFHLQVVQGAKNRELADSNRIYERVIHAPRGVIFDRSGQVLAENNPGFRLKGRFIARDEALSLEARSDPLYESLEVDSIRFYPLSDAAAHILGYVGEVSPQELQADKYKGYKLGDKIGRAGVEAVYEDILRGKDGAEVVEVDATGKKIRSLRHVDPVPGKNLILTIDADLQKAGFESLKQQADKSAACCGAVVAVDPTTGGIITLISSPSFDPNAFTDPERGGEVLGYFASHNAPLLNRAIAGIYPPGSTFKITSALAGLSSGKIDSKTLIEDTGVIHLGPYQFANWYFTEYGGKDGLVDIVKALQRSNDIFFYKLGQMVGEKALAETALKLGFGKKLGIDLPGEEAGLVPSDEWKRDNIGDSWYPGDTLHLSIGQGFLLTTPLQIMYQTSFIASFGQTPVPHVVSKIVGSDGQLIKEFKSSNLPSQAFSQPDLELVKYGLSLVPKNGGTAWPFFNFTIPTAGKTGTAEFGDPKNKTHAWYSAFAPLDNPTIVVTVVVEAGGEGSTVAAPIVKQMFTWYFNPDKSNIKSLDSTAVMPESRRLGE